MQLIDAETGTHLWAERFDKPVTDLFEMQDEIVSRLANRLGQELAAAEAGRAARAATPDSMDHYFLGLAQYNKGPTAEHLDKARSHFDRALDLDPDNVEALAQRAWIDVNFVANYLSDDRAKHLRSAEADLTKALKLRPDHAIAHCALGASRMFSNRGVHGIAECERALAIDRNYANAHGWIGVGKVYVGPNEETEAHILEALRISPRDTRVGIWAFIAGFAKFYSGRDEEAVAWLSRSIEISPNMTTPHFYLAAALARLACLDEAREALRAGLELNPSLTISRLRSLAFSDHPVYLAGRERVYDGLRKAGLPEE
jgi:tetratricopeptide (TPR) repeat protein